MSRARLAVTLAAACLLNACGNKSTDQFDTSSVFSPLATASPSPRTSPTPLPSPVPSPNTSPAASPSPGSSPTPTPSPTTSPVPSPAASPSPQAVSRFVTNVTGVQDYRCGFSPDGTQIVFERTPIPPAGTNTTDYKLMLVNTTGGGTTQLLPANFTRQSTRPNWTPATNRIGFTAEGSDGGSFWICNPDGSNLLRIQPPEFTRVVNYPYFFPDGLTAAVVDYDAAGLQRGVIRRVGTPVTTGVVTNVTVTNLTSATQVLAGMPSVSPNGRYVALAAQSQVNVTYNQDTNQIYVVDLQAPAGTPPMLFDTGQGRAPSWSPSGQTITFESNRATLNSTAPPPTASPDAAPFAIYGKAFTGSPNDVNTTVTQITDKTLDANHCVWSRNGQLLVMTARTVGTARGIFIMSPPSNLR